MRELLLKVEQEIKNRQIPEEEIATILSASPSVTNRRIISGYGSVAVVDRENHRITIPALKEAVKRFMADEHWRNIQIFHSDVSVGRVLPLWTNPETGQTFRTEVDSIGFKILGEIRDDIEIANKVWEEIEKGNIRSFSIAGSSKDKELKHEDGKTFYDINKLDLYEISLCEEPVCPLAKFEMLWNPGKVNI